MTTPGLLIIVGKKSYNLQAGTNIHSSSSTSTVLMVLSRNPPMPFSVLSSFFAMTVQFLPSVQISDPFFSLTADNLTSYFTEKIS